MKKLISNILNGVVILTAVNGLWSCTSESPFETEGEGIVQLRTVVNSITTRGATVGSNNVTGYDQSYLENNCVVYISRKNGVTEGDSKTKDGLIFKARGLENVPSQMTLKAGKYVAEAWTGDSVTASFDKKFFRGSADFNVTKGSTSNVVINCKIQNVVVSINTATIDPNLMQNEYSVKIKNKRGEITLDQNNASSAKGYFMMPNGDKDLEYEITGKRKDGDTFTKTGKIENVQRAHHYILNFSYNPGASTAPSEGAAFIKIHIQDEEIDAQEVVDVHARPTISGVDFNIEKQQDFTDDNNIPESLSLQLCGFGGLSELFVTSESAADLGIPATGSEVNLFSGDASVYRTAGLEWTQPADKNSTGVSTAFLTIPKSMIAKLSKTKADQHIIKIRIKDKDNPAQTKEAEIRIARSASQIVLEDPIVVDQVDQNDWESIKANSVTLAFSLADGVTGTPGVEYSKADEDNWSFVAASVPANAPRRSPMKAAPKKYTVKITGLAAGTAYKYRAACQDENGGTTFTSADVMTFTTESSYTIPDASFEDWSTYKASTLLGTKTVVLPGSTGDKETSFWGSGNEGAATANMTLTDKSTDMKHSGQYSAKLASNAAMGVIAAGNIFTGKYVKTDGTNGVLSVGREYNGSHPSKLRVHANYRPGSNVSAKSENEKYLPANFNGGKDHGQIYVALTTEAVEIRTNPKDRKLFDSNDPVVLAYGEKTWTDNFGPDGQLQLLEIPLTYNDRAKTKKPTHLVIVCSASKYGDYFSGSKTSVMYVDDFELVYE